MHTIYSKPFVPRHHGLGNFNSNILFPNDYTNLFIADEMVDEITGVYEDNRLITVDVGHGGKVQEYLSYVISLGFKWENIEKLYLSRELKVVAIKFKKKESIFMLGYPDGKNRVTSIINLVGAIKGKKWEAGEGFYYMYAKHLYYCSAKSMASFLTAYLLMDIFVRFDIRNQRTLPMSLSGHMFGVTNLAHNIGVPDLVDMACVSKNYSSLKEESLLPDIPVNWTFPLYTIGQTVAETERVTSRLRNMADKVGIQSNFPTQISLASLCSNPSIVRQTMLNLRDGSSSEVFFATDTVSGITPIYAVNNLFITGLSSVNKILLTKNGFVVYPEPGIKNYIKRTINGTLNSLSLAFGVPAIKGE